MFFNPFLKNPGCYAAGKYGNYFDSGGIYSNRSEMSQSSAAHNRARTSVSNRVILLLQKLLICVRCISAL